MPPITPGSAVSVRRSNTFSSATTSATPSGMPMPRLTTALRVSSSAARRAITLRAPSGSGASVLIGTRISPANAALYCVTIGLHVVLGSLGDDDAVDQNAGHLDLARVERAALGEPLDLRDDDAAAVVRRHRDRQRLERQRLALHRQVAVGVGGGRADDPDLDRERLVEQDFLAVDLEQPHQVVAGRRVDLAAAVARIDEGAEADPAERAGLAGRDVAKQVRDARPAAGCRPRSRRPLRAPAAAAPAPSGRRRRA